MPEIDAHRLLAEHIAGDSLRVLGTRYSCSPETARQVVMRAGDSYLTRLEQELAEAARFEAMGRLADWPVLLIPHQAQPDWQTALSFFTWTVDHLRERGIDVQVRTKPLPDGIAFQLTTPSEGAPA